MAINLNDNVKVLSQKPIESKYLNGTIPYTSTAQVNSILTTGLRHIGLTVNIGNVEYWYSTGITNSDLVEKQTSSSGGDVGNGLSLDDTTIILGGDLSQSTVFNDTRGAKVGLEYGGDYSGSYTARSLVDKGYVDNKIESISGLSGSTYVGTFQEVTEQGNTTSCNILVNGMSTTNLTYLVGLHTLSTGYIGYACGDYSHAQGSTTTAFGFASHAEGYGTLACGDYSHTSGMYNVGCTTTISEIGVGLDNSNRCNAFEVYCTGAVAVPQIGTKTTETCIVYIDANGSLKRGALPVGNTYTYSGVTGSVTLTNDNYVVLVDTSSSAATITLPTSPTSGSIKKIKDSSGNADVNNITVEGNGNTIDGNNSAVINTNYGGFEIMYDGSSWKVISFVN